MKRQRPLKFMHVAKNGGTSVEQAAMAAGIVWGGRDPSVTCQTYPHRDRMHASVWTCGSDRIRKLLAECFDWFIIVRNPYERAVSFVNFQSGRLEEAKSCETILQNWLTFPSFSAMPAIKYMHPSAVVHVIRFEHLAEEFAALMQTYNLSIVLEHANKSKSTRFTRSRLCREHIHAINRMYFEDFVEFGYDMIDPDGLPQQIVLCRGDDEDVPHATHETTSV